MSQLELALNIVYILINIPFIVVVMFMIDGHFKFEEYKSMLTVVERRGIKLSLEDEKDVIYGGVLSYEEVLDIMARTGFHTVNYDGKRRLKERDSPWHSSKVDPISGELKDYEDGLEPLNTRSR